MPVAGFPCARPQGHPGKCHSKVKPGARLTNESSGLKCSREVFERYGTVCACCGATDKLCIDHVAGNGSDHSRKLPSGIAKGGPDLTIGDGPPGHPDMTHQVGQAGAKLEPVEAEPVRTGIQVSL
jgi:hypothetical protein